MMAFFFVIIFGLFLVSSPGGYFTMIELSILLVNICVTALDTFNGRVSVFVTSSVQMNFSKWGAVIIS